MGLLSFSLNVAVVVRVKQSPNFIALSTSTLSPFRIQNNDDHPFREEVYVQKSRQFCKKRGKISRKMVLIEQEKIRFAMKLSHDNRTQNYLDELFQITKNMLRR